MRSFSVRNPRSARNTSSEPTFSPKANAALRICEPISPRLAIIPIMQSECPLIYFDIDATTTSTPSVRGWQNTGVAQVPSNIVGMPLF